MDVESVKKITGWWMSKNRYRMCKLAAIGFDEFLQRVYLHLLSLKPSKQYKLTTLVTNACNWICQGHDRAESSPIEFHPDPPDTKTTTSDRDVEIFDNREQLSCILDCAQLQEREIKIVQDRFVRQLTLKEAALDNGVSKERARQIEARAIRKIRRAYSGHLAAIKSMSPSS